MRAPQTSTTSLLERKMRTLRPFSRVRTPTRSPFLVTGLNNITREMWIGISRSTMPPVTPALGFGRWCFLAMFRFSTITRLPSITLRMAPRRPLSLPAITMTSSPFLILLMPVRSSRSQHFRRQRNDAHEPLGAQLARYRPEDARTDGLQLVVEQHRGIAVETDQRTVRAAHAAPGTHHHCFVDLALLDLAARNGVADAHLDDIADARIAAFGAAQHLDAFQAACADVVGGIEHGAHLDHDCASAWLAAGAGCACARISTSFQALWREIGRQGAITTVSPSWQAFCSSCALILVRRRRILPYSGCVTTRSTTTVMVLSILLLSTRPVTVRSGFTAALLVVICPLPWPARRARF